MYRIEHFCDNCAVKLESDLVYHLKMEGGLEKVDPIKPDGLHAYPVGRVSLDVVLCETCFKELLTTLDGLDSHKKSLSGTNSENAVY